MVFKTSTAPEEKMSSLQGFTIWDELAVVYFYLSFGLFQFDLFVKSRNLDSGVIRHCVIVVFCFHRFGSEIGCFFHFVNMATYFVRSRMHGV